MHCAAHNPPVCAESLLCGTSTAGSTSGEKFYNDLCESQEGAVPIIYHDGVNVTLWGLENIHPFDTKKYQKIASGLLQSSIGPFIRPRRLTMKVPQITHGHGIVAYRGMV
jgi:hypothetical protein